MRKAPGSSGGENPGPGGIETEAVGIFAVPRSRLNGLKDTNSSVRGF